jgi:hypothetical protein
MGLHETFNQVRNTESQKEEPNQMKEYLAVTEESKLHIKDYDRFSNNQVRMINAFNRLSQEEREYLLPKFGLLAN